jgi:DNA-binding transcriptional MerR regulator
MADYTDTTTKLARDAELTQPTIRKYADLGLLDFIVASDGTKLFKPGQAARVKDIHAKRMAGRYVRGRRRTIATPA